MPIVSHLPWQELDGSLRAFIGRRVRNQADVDDLVQRVLLQIVKGVGSVRDAERLHDWVYRTARNAIADYYRSPISKREIPSGDGDDHMASAVAPAVAIDDERIALEELASCLTPMLNRLQPAYREAVTLTDLQGMTQAAAAAHAGVSLSGMKSRVQRGRRQLRDLLEACCRVDLDHRGGIVGFAPRQPDTCPRCETCD
jgi:RNA polymerase sigma-70 factor (ECF subfamily)